MIPNTFMQNLAPIFLNRMRRILHVHPLGLLSACAVSSCILACASSAPLQTPDRIRAFQAPTTSNGVVFVPKGAFLTGNSAAQHAVDSWVRLLPASSWPESVPKPTLLVGRIASHQARSARIEILATQSSIRDASPAIEFYPNNGARSPQNAKNNAPNGLHAISKRLVYPIGNSNPNDDALLTGLGQLDWMEGSEIYAVIDLNADPKTRLASHIQALATVDQDSLQSNEIRLSRAAGRFPKSAACVLLDAPDPPAYDVRVAYYGNDSTLISRVKALLNSKLPGADRIQFDFLPPQKSLDDHLSDLAQTETDILELRVIDNGQQRILLSQNLRLHRAPWFAIPERPQSPNADDADDAYAIAIHALQMLGHHASAIFIAENSWNSLPLRTRANIAPALAYAYHAIARDDWALELGLELHGYAKQASGSEKKLLYASTATVMAIAGRSDEFSDARETAFKNISHLPPLWQKSLAYALLEAGTPNSIAKLRTYLRSKPENWTEFDDLRLCLYVYDRENSAQPMPSNIASKWQNPPVTSMSEWLDYCDDKSQRARLPFVTTAYETLDVIRNGTLEEMLQMTTRVDAIGFPYLASILWREIALAASEETAITRAWQNAAEYAKLSQNKRLFLNMMNELARFMQKNGTPLPPEWFRDALSGWRALDMRYTLASHLVARAKTSSAMMAAELLKHAAELFLSIGDGENYAAVQTMLNDLSR